MGACQYVRKFIRDFSTYAAPLHGLTKAGPKFEWSEKHEEAFQLLKRKISEAPVLALPSLQRPFEVETDASTYAMGAVLLQDGKPVEYYSELFTGSIRNYPTYDKEFYALYQAIKHWRVYLLGKEVVVHSDHKPLEYLHAQTKLQQAKHDKHRVPCNFRVGDLVWLKLSKERLKGEGKKLKPLRYGPFRILQQIGDNAFKLDLPPYLGMYSVINAEYLKLFEPPLLDDDGDDKVVLPPIDDLWFDKEEPLKEDCILEQKVTKTRQGERAVFRIGRAGQVLSQSKWFSKEKGTLEFPNLQF